MKCSECRYLKYIEGSHVVKGGYEYTICDITHIINPISCPIPDDELVKDAEICYNCKHWSGGGDFGLSCSKHYYIASTNGFSAICELFERK